jgi:hypothetical protein
MLVDPSVTPRLPPNFDGSPAIPTEYDEAPVTACVVRDATPSAIMRSAMTAIVASTNAPASVNSSSVAIRPIPPPFGVPTKRSRQAPSARFHRCWHETAAPVSKEPAPDKEPEHGDR